MARGFTDFFSGRQPGYWFKNGKLYVFSDEQLTIITATPQARAIRKLPARPWAEFMPVPKLVYPYRPKRKKKPTIEQQSFDFYVKAAEAPDTPKETVSDKRRALDGFRFSLPKFLTRQVEPFPNRQFAVIRFWQRHRSFRDLLQSNRPLAFCVANPHLLGCSFDRCRLELKQRDILAELGFPNSKSAVQILKRMSPESLYASHLMALRRILYDSKKLKHLQHASHINAGLLQVLGDNEVFSSVTPSFIEEVAKTPAEKYRARAADLVHELLYFDAELPGATRFGRLSSVARAEKLHTELGRHYAKVHRLRILKCRFPRPPIAGSNSIVPIRSPRELVIEGETQHNCVATYADQVESGQTYIYRVLAPERATLSVKRQPDGNWVMTGLKAACNQSVTQATSQAVMHWLYPV